MCYLLAYDYGNWEEYEVTVFGFDRRYYAERKIISTVTNFPCSNPVVYLPLNFTSFERQELIPSFKKSEEFQFEAFVDANCTESMNFK